MFIAVTGENKLIVRPEADDSCYCCDFIKDCPLVQGILQEWIIPRGSNIRITGCLFSKIVRSSSENNTTNN